MTDTAKNEVAITRLITASMAGKRWRDLTPLEVAQYLVAHGVIPKAAIESIKTHNGAPVIPGNLRWAASHEALARSWTYDVLTGLADLLEKRES